MTTKNYGPGASGYLNPQGRNWETTVYQTAKPVLDKELNLVQDVGQEAALRLQRRTCPSGWLSDNFRPFTSRASSIVKGSASSSGMGRKSFTASTHS